MNESSQEDKKKNWYDKYYKIILLIPVIVLILSLVYLANFQSKHGDIILKDVTITGGTTITVFSPIQIKEIEEALSSDFPDIKVRAVNDFRTGAQNGFILETKAGVDNIKPVLENFLGFKLTQENSSIEFSGETLSRGFYQQLRFAILLAFISMAIVILLIFRTFVPSIAVIFAAFADIVMTIATVNLLGIELSIAGVVAFLMLIGYSVDTDILLTSRVLKKDDLTINQRIYSALKTGIMMTLTSIIAVSVALLVIRGISEVLAQIFIILLIGLGFDIFNTWITNASMIKWYAEKKEAK